MTNPDQMVAWLREAMDTAQRDAEAATPGPWAPEEPMLADVVTSALLGRVADCSVGTGYRPRSLPDARHIARHDPAAVLRRIAADRAILDLWEDPEKVRHLPDGVYDGRDPDEVEAQVAAAEAIDSVVRLLAEGYGWVDPNTTSL